MSVCEHLRPGVLKLFNLEELLFVSNAAEEPFRSQLCFNRAVQMLTELVNNNAHTKELLDHSYG